VVLVDRSEVACACVCVCVFVCRIDKMFAGQVVQEVLGKYLAVANRIVK